MAVSSDSYIPYAPAGTVLTAIRAGREGRLPNPTDTTSILRIGVSKGNAGRTVAALKFLKLIDDDGKHTEAMNALTRASTDDYPSVLSEILKEAYADIFEVIDPSTATDIQVNDAFRGFQPAKQRNRMVTLFVGLCQEADILAGEPTITQRRNNSSSRLSSSSINKTINKPAQQSNNSNLQEIEVQHSPQKNDIIVTMHRDSYPILSAYFSQLPVDGIWENEEQRSQWLQGVTVALEFETKVKPSSKTVTVDEH